MIRCQKSSQQTNHASAELQPMSGGVQAPALSTTEDKTSLLVGGPVFLPPRPLSRWARALVADSELASQNVA